MRLALVVVVMVVAAGLGGAAARAAANPDFGPFQTRFLGPYEEAGTVTVADVNGDGRADVVATTGKPAVYVLPQLADHTLGPTREYALPAPAEVQTLDQ